MPFLLDGLHRLIGGVPGVNGPLLDLLPSSSDHRMPGRSKRPKSNPAIRRGFLGLNESSEPDPSSSEPCPRFGRMANVRLGSRCIPPSYKLYKLITRPSIDEGMNIYNWFIIVQHKEEEMRMKFPWPQELLSKESVK